MANGISRDDNDGNKKKKRRTARKSTDPKRSKRVQDKRVESKDKKDKKQLDSVQNLYQASPNERRKKLLCVDFLAAVMSLDRTQEQKDHYKSKCVMCAELTYLQRSTLLPWFCMSISWGQRGSTRLPTYGITSMDTSQREFQHSFQHSSIHMTLKWQIKRLWNNLYPYNENWYNTYVIYGIRCILYTYIYIYYFNVSFI